MKTERNYGKNYKSRIFQYYLGFPANEKFRDKMRKFSVAFRKISRFFAKINESKTKLFFWCLLVVLNSIY